MIWLDRALLISPIYFGLCKDEEDFNKELKRLGIKKSARPEFISENSNATVHFFDNKKEVKKCCIVCVKNEKGISKIQMYALLVHEAVHI